MIDSSEMAAVSHRLGMQNDITNGSEVAKIWILWKEHLSLQGPKELFPFHWFLKAINPRFSHISYPSRIGSA